MAMTALMITSTMIAICIQIQKGFKTPTRLAAQRRRSTAPTVNEIRPTDNLHVKLTDPSTDVTPTNSQNVLHIVC